MGHGRAGVEGRRHGSDCTAANFKRDEGGDGQRQKNRERDEETGFDGENRRSQHAGEGQDREKTEIAIRTRGIETHERGKNHQMDGGEKRGVQRRIRRGAGQIARENPEIDGEKQEVSEHEPSRYTDRDFGSASTPDAEAFVDQGDQGNDERNGVELAGEDDGEDAGRDQEKKRDLEIALDRGQASAERGRRGRLDGMRCGGGHNPNGILALAASAAAAVTRLSSGLANWTKERRRFCGWRWRWARR